MLVSRSGARGSMPPVTRLLPPPLFRTLGTREDSLRRIGRSVRQGLGMNDRRVGGTNSSKRALSLIWVSGQAHSGSLRMMVASEERLTSDALQPILSEFSGQLACVTVVGVVPHVGIFEYWGTAEGLTPPDRFLAEYAETASAVARSGVTQVPDGIPATHLAAESWPAALRLARQYDVLLVGGRQCCKRDRRAVSAFTRTLVRP